MEALKTSAELHRSLSSGFATSKHDRSLTKIADAKLDVGENHPNPYNKKLKVIYRS